MSADKSVSLNAYTIYFQRSEEIFIKKSFNVYPGLYHDTKGIRLVVSILLLVSIIIQPITVCYDLVAYE